MVYNVLHGLFFVCMQRIKKKKKQRSNLMRQVDNFLKKPNPFVEPYKLFTHY